MAVYRCWSASGKADTLGLLRASHTEASTTIAIIVGVKDVEQTIAIAVAIFFIGQAIEEFEDWSKEMVVSPTIQKLKNSLEQIRKEELTRFLKNAKPEEAQKLEEMSRSLMQKILKYPVLHLKAACKRGDAESLSEVLQELFNLEKSPEKTGHR